MTIAVNHYDPRAAVPLGEVLPPGSLGTGNARRRRWTTVVMTAAYRLIDCPEVVKTTPTLTDDRRVAMTHRLRDGHEVTVEVPDLSRPHFGVHTVGDAAVVLAAYLTRALAERADSNC